MDCIFCEMVNGAIPSMKVYEDENVLVIMDIAKDVDGHMLAIPKKHVKSILDCDSETLSQLVAVVQKVSQNCVDQCEYEGVNLLNANGESAGQSVPHFHIHIIPRRTGDSIDAWPNFEGSKQEITYVYDQLKMI